MENLYTHSYGQPHNSEVAVDRQALESGILELEHLLELLHDQWRGTSHCDEEVGLKLYKAWTSFATLFYQCADVPERLQRIARELAPVDLAGYIFFERIIAQSSTGILRGLQELETRLERLYIPHDNGYDADQESGGPAVVVKSAQPVVAPQNDTINALHVCRNEPACSRIPTYLVLLENHSHIS